MATIPQTASSVEEFVEIASMVREAWRLEEVLPWFRGHTNAEWDLKPKFYRQNDITRGTEDEIREEFCVRAPNLAEYTPTNRWDWYFLMQHYGAPTRLLDWTEGALIGLYFAVKDNPGYYPSAVWVLDAWDLNKRVVKTDEVVPPGDPGVTPQDRRRYDRWLPDRFAKGKRWPEYPVAIYPGHTVRRIGAQRSCFTIHGSDFRGLEDIAKDIGGHLMMITIPSWQTRAIKRSLQTCGIDETTVFPDLRGLSSSVAATWTEPDEPSPHHEVYARLCPSKVHKGGVGVFAIRPIRKGTKLFVGDNAEMVWVNKKDVPRAPKSIRKLYEDFPVIRTDPRDGETRYGCPLSFNRLTMSWYLNESEDPNVECDEFYNFRATKDIEPSEELTVDYSKYSE